VLLKILCDYSRSSELISMSSVFLKISCASWCSTGLVLLVSLDSSLSASLFALVDGIALVLDLYFVALA